MCVGLNIYIDDNLMFTELSSRERVSVCENMHLINLHAISLKFTAVEENKGRESLGDRNLRF